MEEAARRIQKLGPRNVLVKGGHLKDSATDILWDGRAFRRYTAPRLDSPHTHGTGCTLSAAIAGHLARGEPLPEAVRAGKAFVTEAIRGALPLGEGIGPVDQLWPVPREGLA
jgi:hydroxymethylpyrimidine kinase/phosphomethylpyrimidine kinase